MAITAGGAGFTGVWIEAYILRRFVDMLKDELLFADYSEPAQIPRNTGGYVARWNIPVAFTGSTTVITEASAGTVGERTSTEIGLIESTINTYGEFMKIGEISKESFISGTLDVYSEQFMFAGASAIDSLLYTAAKTTTNFLHSGDKTTGGTTLTIADAATVDDFPSVASFFHSQNAKGFRSLNGDYAWLIHPRQEIDLMTEWTSTANYWSDTVKHVPQGFDQLIKKHRFVGRYGGVTALRTTMIGVVAEDVTAAFASIALARWGLGWAGLGENGPSSPTIKYKKPGPNDTSQPMDLYETIAWKVKMAAAMLDVKRCLVVYSNDNSVAGQF